MNQFMWMMMMMMVDVHYESSNKHQLEVFNILHVNFRSVEPDEDMTDPGALRWIQ